MKSIMMSIRPKWVAKIINGAKTIEVRKRFPVDYVGWVYIYCTKDKSGNNNGNVIGRCYPMGTSLKVISGRGKVVARFWCDKVEEIKLPYTKFGTNEWVGCEAQRTLQTETMDEPILLEKSCLSEEEIYKYLNFKYSPSYCGTAIHITKLEIFDKPKDLSDYVRRIKPKRTRKDAEIEKIMKCKTFYVTEIIPLTRAPQSWCYIEGK